ncbi:MAG: class I SAM-dependent methyltransferase [Kofleriaceae bacterium]|nr:class I SAM-dependent methyltransferase [Myxococcales bacterium]MCB9562287.1 class I SAM-dependent methyltransferase [Kofleriaceae bacterium]
MKLLVALLAVATSVAAACDRGATADDRRAPHGRHDARDARDDDQQAAFDRERRPDLVVATIDLHPGDVVADVGAGTGLLTIHIARAVTPGGKVVATDVDSGVLDLLAARMHDAGLDGVVERRVVPSDDPSLEAGTYDVILLAQVDHFFEDRVAWLRTALPALKPGGKLVITNRMHHRAPAMDAAEQAGLHLVRESTDVPGSFVAVFQLAAPTPPAKDSP